jgi:hypothetical protein
MPPQSSADLAKRYGGVPTEELAKQFGGTVEPDAPQSDAQMGPIGRGLAGLWEQVNPLTLVQSFAALGHPIDAASQAMQQQGALYDKAKQAFAKGNYVEGARHGLNYLLPLIGPQLDALSDKGQQGDVAGMIGGTVGLGGTMFGPEAAQGVVKSAAQTSLAANRAAAMERSAAANMADVMSPKVGPNKVRFGNMAKDVAPVLAADPEMTSLSREALHRKVTDRLETAQDKLDAAADARNAGHAFPAEMFLAPLEQAKQALTAEAVKASHVQPTTVVTGQPFSDANVTKVAAPIGTDVVPSPSNTRVAQIDKAIAEIKQLGPLVRYESIRRIRQAYDGPARVKYAPSITADFLAKQGEAAGAADVTRSIREPLAGIDPATAAANREYSLYKKANDVLDATAEIERTRPTVGRKIMAMALGGMAGGAVGGRTLGEVVGALLGPTVDSAISTASQGRKILMARTMSDMADALRSGDVGRIRLRLQQLRNLSVAAQAMTPVASHAVSEDQP